MMKYMAKGKQIIQQLQKFNIEQISRAKNIHTEALSRIV